MNCKTFDRLDEQGNKLFKPKKQFDNLEDVIAVCKIENFKPHRINKVVPYYCNECHKYHTGRNGKSLTEKYINKLRVR